MIDRNQLFLLVALFFVASCAAERSLVRELRKRNYPAAFRLIERGANVNERGKIGDTPLIIAARYGNLKMVKALLKKSADIDAVNEKHRDALIKDRKSVV